MNGEAFARLNAKTQSWTDSGGGVVEFTEQDLAAAMSGLTKIGGWFIWYKFVDRKEKDRGYYILVNEAIQRVYDAGKNPKKKNTLWTLFDIALEDYMGDIICPKCKGRSEIHHENRIFKCSSSRCHDGKIRERYDSERARAMGVDKTAYSRHYKPAYGIISDYLTKTLPEEESAAFRIISRQAR